MNDILFILPSLLAIFVLILIVKAAAIGLRLTGMDEKKAAFQALSALTGSGFTTRESELIVNHPIRRRIISLLMIVGYAGFITIIVTFSSSIIATKGYLKYANLFLFFIGLYLIYLLASYKGFIKRWDRFIREKLVKSHKFEEASIEDLIQLIEGYGLIRVVIHQNSTLVNQKLMDLELPKSNILVLGIDRDDKWNPIPKGEEILKKDDKLVVYGHIAMLKKKFEHS
jgi:hypothetical protein